MRLEGLHRASITERPYPASASQHNYPTTLAWNSCAFPKGG